MNSLAIHAFADNPDFEIKDLVSMAIVNDMEEAKEAKERFLRIPEIDPNTSPLMALWDHRIVCKGWIYMEWYGKFKAQDESDEFLIPALKTNKAFQCVYYPWKK